ncbi:MAG: ATP-binding cassette domain-containing protein [Clostridia bacterium]|nr:ATP-binding cassette domain-containing protein [Oscillospiraceae bacterium]MBR4892623.1 ATP-binding cassette domain-containing protein [Clostridia bacterium]
MIEISNLYKSYGKRQILKNINFTVNKGEILGFLGPNGAGKTTTMSIITGYLSYTEGSVKVDGMEVIDNPMEIKRKIGYLPELPPVYLDMTVLEYLKFVYELKKVKLDFNAHITSVMNSVSIFDVKDRLIKHLSKGYRQRVGFAAALVGDPEILILDEPTVGLDPNQIIEIRNVIKQLGKNKTVIISSHILQEISAICDKVVIISCGEIVAADSPEKLSNEYTKNQQLSLRIAGERGAIKNVLQSVPGVRGIKEVGIKENDSYDFILDVETGFDVRKPLFNVLSKNSMPVLMMQPAKMTLEDVFIELTKKANTKGGKR